MFEYKSVDFKNINDRDIPELLNKEANDGWRFVAFHRHVFLLLERQLSKEEMLARKEMQRKEEMMQRKKNDL